MNDYRVQIMDLPVKEMVSEDEDGDYVIFINAKLSYDDQRKAFDHAMYHITHHDFEKFDVQEIEAEAHHASP